MASIGSTAIPSNFTAQLGDSDTVVEIFNIEATNAGTEYSQALPMDTKAFLLKTREKNVELQLAYTSGFTEFVTIPANGVYEDLNFYSGQTIFFKSSLAGATVELVAYSKV